eukprot:gene31136-38479_t
MSWIKSTLSENGDLRPEVRNGLSMIMIYSFGTAKAACEPGLDMFNALQDVEHGLAIINKTSLKIYNDPYFFYGFLKSCMSGLIDAGKIQENERTNHPKKPKQPFENKDELVAYLQMKNILVGMFNRGEIENARTKIAQITAVWTEKHKNIRNNWFATALNILGRDSVFGVTSLLSPVLLSNLDASLMGSNVVNNMTFPPPPLHSQSHSSTNSSPTRPSFVGAEVNGGSSDGRYGGPLFLGAAALPVAVTSGTIPPMTTITSAHVSTVLHPHSSYSSTFSLPPASAPFPSTFIPQQMYTAPEVVENARPAKS